MQVGAPVGERQDGDGDGFAVECGNGETYAFDGDRAFVDHPWANAGRDADFEGPVGCVAVEIRAGLGDDGIEGGEGTAVIDVALDDVSAERASGCGGQFQIDFGAGGERAERCAVESFLGQVGVEPGWVDVESG